MFLCTKCKLGFMDFQNYCSTIVDKGKLDGTVEDRGSKSFRISRVPRQSAIFSMIRLPSTTSMVGARMDPEAIPKCKSGSDAFLLTGLGVLGILHQTMGQTRERTLR